MRRDNTGATSSLYAKTTGVTINTGWQAVGAETQVAPVGVIEQYGGTSAPTGWLLCDGSAVSRTTYDALFAVLGTTYGAGDGSTTFNLPDMQGRVPVGFSSGGKTEVATLGNSDGLAANLRNISHHHTYDTMASNKTIASGGAAVPDSPANTSGDADNTDNSAFLVVNYIIKT